MLCSHPWSTLVGREPLTALPCHKYNGYNVFKINLFLLLDTGPGPAPDNHSSATAPFQASAQASAPSPVSSPAPASPPALVPAPPWPPFPALNRLMYMPMKQNRWASSPYRCSSGRCWRVRTGWTRPASPLPLGGKGISSLATDSQPKTWTWFMQYWFTLMMLRIDIYLPLQNQYANRSEIKSLE